MTVAPWYRLVRSAFDEPVPLHDGPDMVHRSLSLELALASLLGVSLAAASSADARALAPAAAQAPKPKTSSQLLREGEALQQQGEHAKAGQLYRSALEALADQKRRANEGARAAMLSADAHWLAFAQDLDVDHLQAAIDVLSVWLTFTGPDSRASLRLDVERTIGRLKTVHETLGAANAALAKEQVDEAKTRYDQLLEALSAQRREWSVGARIVLQASAGLVAIYDGHVPSLADTSERVRELEAARALLVRWKDERPPDEASPEEPAVEQQLAAVEAKLEAERARAEQARADEARAAEARRKADEAEVQRKLDERRERDEAEQQRRAQKAAGRRTTGGAMLPTGLVMLGAGVGLFAEGLAYHRELETLEADDRAEAEAYEQMAGVEFDRAGYESAWDSFRATADARNRGMIIGGSVLAAGGVAVAVVGVVKLVQARKGRERADPPRARLLPSGSLVTVKF